MTKSTSVFLDLLRLLAALVVFASHIEMVDYGDSVWIPGHAAVLVFFVLSGYVIAFSTLTSRGMNATRYAIARLTRLYSVVLPALLLTGLLLLLGRALHPFFYASLWRAHDGLRFAFTGFFLQSIWWRNLSPPTNGPFWSLGYEAWYYAIFGFWVFIRKPRLKWAAILGCCLLVGENVLLLFPIWLFGAAIYLGRDRFPLSVRAATAGFILSVIATGLLMTYLPEYPGTVGIAPLFYSASYLTDFLTGLGVSAVIWFFVRAGGHLRVAPMWEKGIHWGANHTFSLYLFHLPLIYFVRSLGIFNRHVPWQMALEILLILGVITGLSEVTETRRKWLQKALLRRWEKPTPQEAAS